MKKLSIPCTFGPQNHSVDFYVGQPKVDKHPIQNQSSWLSSARGGAVPDNVMQSLEKLHDLSTKNRVNFADLCEYAVGTAGDNNAVEQQEGDSKKIAEGTVKDNAKLNPQSENAESHQTNASSYDGEISKDVDMAIQDSLAINVDKVRADTSVSDNSIDESTDRSIQDNLANSVDKVKADAGTDTNKVYDLSSAEPIELQTPPVDKPLDVTSEVSVKSKSSSSFNLNNAMASSAKNSDNSRDSESKLTDDDIDEFLNS